LLSENNESSFYKKKFYRLNKALVKIIDDYSLVKFHPLDVSDEDSINDILLIIDNVLQYGEDHDVKEPKEFEINEDIKN
jgi:hypothetical protein